MSTSCEQYETYTVKLDSRGAATNSSFVGYIDIPLRNVVKVEVLSANIDSNLAHFRDPGRSRLLSFNLTKK